jgi:hypothetical protein
LPIEQPGSGVIFGAVQSGTVIPFPLARRRAFIDRHARLIAMATIVQCNCGAEYGRTEEKFLVPHTGDAVCTVCGAALESWRESTHVPTYELIERPERKPE